VSWPPPVHDVKIGPPEDGQHPVRCSLCPERWFPSSAAALRWAFNHSRPGKAPSPSQEGGTDG
jgi:hypothetical protein